MIGWRGRQTAVGSFLAEFRGKVGSDLGGRQRNWPRAAWTAYNPSKSLLSRMILGRVGYHGRVRANAIASMALGSVPHTVSDRVPGHISGSQSHPQYWSRTEASMFGRPAAL